MPTSPPPTAAPSSVHHGVARVGRRARRVASRPIDITRFVGALVLGATASPPAARTLWRREARDQVLAGAVRATPFVAAVAFVLGVTIVVEARAEGLPLQLADALGRLLGALVVRELGPLLAAVVVVGRSGTAMAAELAAAGALGETEALDALGVDPVTFFALPRVIAGAVNVTVLAVFFDAFALCGSAAAAYTLAGVAPSEFFGALRAALSPADLWVTVAKGVIFGAGAIAVCCHAGLLGVRSSTDVPRSVTRAVVYALLFAFAVSAVFSFTVYA